MKIALCLCGKSGGTEKAGLGIKLEPNFTFQHYKKFVINENVDVFIHCWNPEDKKALDSLYNPISSIYENPVSTNNVESRHLSIQKCLNLVRKQKKIYDYVMISRLDVVFLSPVDFSKIKPNCFSVGHWNDRGQTNNHLSGIYDVWMVANLAVFDKLLKDVPRKFFLLNPHHYWVKLMKYRKMEINYIPYFVGKDYELTRRYYYPNNMIADEEVYSNLQKFIKDFPKV